VRLPIFRTLAFAVVVISPRMPEIDGLFKRASRFD